ncbi:telomere resolvase [Acaryochloris sp. CCMEE 5410]|uniref:telomere resolvase n=1 Tax=Acaryochloris sp. CCMEE 5410 TaxID=310037 RepID=UPI0021CE7BB7|nr:telomere resolvase [Acaryochloris sp. CCMEE 5410]KAI9131963.1 hypothetical protein ON05_000025 [Acaryochloris sp. CCMEE 5410]
MRLWLEKIYNTTFFPAIASLQDTPKDHEIADHWTAWMKQQWKTHGLETLNQQKNLMVEVRQALKEELAENHVIFEHMRFTTDEWTEINLQAGSQPREGSIHLITNPDAIVAKASQLLKSCQWANIIAGLTVITGRRCAELLKTATFSYQSPFSLWFTGTPKLHPTKPHPAFELPTLVPAEQVMDSITQIRDLLDTKFMDNREINRHYGNDVALACDLNFADLIDYQSVEGNLYTQLSRTIYARIATHWYAPPQILDIDFMAAIQGHFIILQTKDVETKKSLAKKRHYFDYFIGNEIGKINRQQGIRLHDPNVSVLVGLHPDDGPPPQSLPSDQASDFPDLEQRIEPSPNLQAAIQHFLSALATLETPEDIRELVKGEISKFKHYSDFFGVYQSAIQAAVHSGDLPLIDSKTASWKRYTKEGISYEERQHYALVFLTNPDIPIATPSPPHPVSTPPLKSHTTPTTANQSLDTISHTLSELCQTLLQPQQSHDNIVPSPLEQKIDTLIAALTQLCLVLLQQQQISKRVSSPSPPQVAPPIKKRGRGRLDPEEANAKIHRAIDAIMAFNNTPNRSHEEMWRIGISSLKRLTHSSQSVIQRVHKQREKILMPIMRSII